MRRAKSLWWIAGALAMGMAFALEDASTVQAATLQWAPTPWPADANWAGLVIQAAPGAPQTYVSGTFTVPAVTAAPGHQRGDLSIWVGLGGVNAPLIQCGIWESVTPLGTTVQPFAEMVSLPPNVYQDGRVGTPFPIFPTGPNYWGSVAPGDTVTATVQAIPPGTYWQWATGWLMNPNASNMYEMTVVDDTTGQTVLTQFVVPGATTDAQVTQTAEWVVEDPVDANTQAEVPWADFGQVTFTQLEYNGAGGTAVWQPMANANGTATPTSMVGGFTVNQALAEPTP